MKSQYFEKNFEEKKKYCDVESKFIKFIYDKNIWQKYVWYICIYFLVFNLLRHLFDKRSNLS